MQVNVDANLVQRKGTGSSMVAFGQIEDGKYILSLIFPFGILSQLLRKGGLIRLLIFIRHLYLSGVWSRVNSITDIQKTSIYETLDYLLKVC